MVRAMDESLVLQQRDMYWNATGMMNNWWFRVAVHRFEENGKSKVRFEHPTLAGTASGGWMERMKTLGLDPRKPVFGKGSDAVRSQPTAPKEEVKMTREDGQTG